MTTRPYTFARHGARTFIALGPLPNAASCAEENVNISGLTDVAFVMGNALLGPLLASPRGRLVLGKLLERVVEALTTKRSLKRERESLR